MEARKMIQNVRNISEPAKVAEKISRAPGYRFARRVSKTRASAVREILKVTERPDIISFAGGLPAPELFPVEQLGKAHADIFREEGAAAMQYSTTEGWRPLREWIAGRLQTRGIKANADQVLITSGSQQGINLMSKIFIEPGDAVVVENPCYLAALQAFNSFEASFVTLESDGSGMRLDHLENAIAETSPKFIYVVSNFHNPKGTTLSLERRKQLIEISRRYRVPILEDDPYGELRYSGERITPLAALDKDELVVYLSTFSKTLSPGMRIGWAYAPKGIFQAMVSTKQATDLHTSTIQQRAAARMLSSFDFDSHLERLRTVYGERCRAMLKAMEKYFPTEVRWTKPNGGMFIWVELPESLNGEAILAEALEDHVAFVPGSAFFARARCENFIRLNFSNRPPDIIEEGIRRIGNLLKRKIQ